MDRAPDESCELHGERPVEAEVVAQRRLLGLRRVLPDHEHHRVAGEIEQRERDERHRDQDGERLDNATKDEGGHGEVR